jgi:hypothetical protein
MRRLMECLVVDRVGHQDRHGIMVADDHLGSRAHPARERGLGQEIVVAAGIEQRITRRGPHAHRLETDLVKMIAGRLDDDVIVLGDRILFGGVERLVEERSPDEIAEKAGIENAVRDRHSEFGARLKQIQSEMPIKLVRDRIQGSTVGTLAERNNKLRELKNPSRVGGAIESMRERRAQAPSPVLN